VTIRPIPVADLEGNKVARRFEGADHGATISLFVGRFPPGTGAKLHRHPYDETFVLEEGGATFTVDGATVEAQAGSILVVPAGAAHGFVSSGEVDLHQISIHAAGRMVQEWLED